MQSAVILHDKSKREGYALRSKCSTIFKRYPFGEACVFLNTLLDKIRHGIHLLLKIDDHFHWIYAASYGYKDGESLDVGGDDVPHGLPPHDAGREHGVRPRERLRVRADARTRR